MEFRDGEGQIARVAQRPTVEKPKSQTGLDKVNKHRVSVGGTLSVDSVAAKSRRVET